MSTIIIALWVIVISFMSCWWLPPSPLEQYQTDQFPGFMWRHSMWQLSDGCKYGTTEKNVAGWRQWVTRSLSTLRPRTTLTILMYFGRHLYWLGQPDLVGQYDAVRASRWLSQNVICDVSSHNWHEFQWHHMHLSTQTWHLLLSMHDAMMSPQSSPSISRSGGRLSWSSAPSL